MASASNQSLLSLARFAFNIYGSLASDSKPNRGQEPHRPHYSNHKKLMYSCEREITCLSQLHNPLGRLAGGFSDSLGQAPSHHVVIGGKNYLKLLALNLDQLAVVTDVNIVDPGAHSLSRIHSSLKLFNVNTVKCYGDMVACGLTNGAVSIYQVSGSGKSRLAYKLEDHKRVVNSVDFTDQEHVLFSGSQDGTVKLWDLRTFSPKPVLKLAASQHSDPVRSCEYSRHLRVRGKMTVLSVHDSGSLCKFDMRYPSSNHTTALLPERKWTFHTGPALSLHIHPESEYVLTGGRDRKICVWNYGETSLHLNSPDITLNTYGPVMKIRWSNTPTHTPQSGTGFDFADEYQHLKLTLYDYDFACLYLNDDPTITVFNLLRKFVPKEIVTTTSLKPIQNFIWASNPASGDKKLWTITKSNVFVSYNLTTGDDGLLNVTRPLEDLPAVAATWQNGYADLSIVSQDYKSYTSQAADLMEHESDILDRSNFDEFSRIDEDRPLEHQTSSVTLDSPYAKTPIGSLPNPSNLLYQKAQNNSSPKDRPQLIRLSTAYTPTKSPSPVPHGRSSMVETIGSLMRPSLPRNPSQSTQDSEGPLFMHTLTSHASSSKKHLFNGPSPYLVGVNVPIPLGDENIFDVLANEYHISVPDGFGLSDVCQMNARLAASVHRFRDCQVWRLLSVALDQEEYELYAANLLEQEEELEQDESQERNEGNEDLKSISSDLGNFVGSFNSNSTLTTTYGGITLKRIGSPTSLTNLQLLASSRASSRGVGSLGDFKSPSTSSLLELAQRHALSSSPIQSRANSLLAKRSHPIFASKDLESEHEQAIDDEEEEISEHSTLPIKRELPRSLRNGLSNKSSAKEIKQNNNHPFGTQNVGLSPDFMSDHSPLMYSRRTQGRGSLSSSFAGTPQPWTIQSSPHDLDNENLNILTTATAASFTSSGFLPGNNSVQTANSGARSRPSMLSMKSSPMLSNLLIGRGSFSGGKSNISMGIKQSSSQPLDIVEESSLSSVKPQKSELTRAFKERNNKLEEADDERFMDKPWNTLHMLKKAIDYAMEQGDIIMCSTLILLFYEPFHKHFPSKVLSKSSCLECLGMFIETLRKKQLFTNAVKVVKEAPSDLRYELGVYASKEVDLRFYCCWCNKLMVNEMSKAKFGAGSDNFGYWYCDECQRKQLNCVYCNEPCKGLTVVVSLKCGHRGHFGCLQEWFILDQNSECPGGCDESIFMDKLY